MGIDAIQGSVRADISEVLSKLREVSDQTKLFSDRPAEVKNPETHFDGVLSIAKDAVNNVNSLQSTTEQLKNAYIAGDSNVSMSQVIVASQKSKLAFEGLITVRNKLLEGYKEIMSMPV